MQKTVYNTFDFISRLSIPKETEKFKPHSKEEYTSKWVKESLKLNARITDSSEMITIEDGYYNKNGHTFTKNGASVKNSDGSYSKGSKITIAWKDRLSKTIMDKVANNQKFIFDMSNNKERYIVKNAIEKLNDDAISEEEFKKIKSQLVEYSLIDDLEPTIENKDTIKLKLEELLPQLEEKKKEFLSRVDMLQEVYKIIKTEEGTNTILHTSGNIVYSEWNGKVRRVFEVRKIEKALPTDKLKLTGSVDLYFNDTSLDESLFDDTKKYIVNAWTKTYDSQLKQQIYVPLTLIVDGSKLDLNNDKHIRRLNGLIKPFKFDVEGKEKDTDKIYQIQYEVKFANGSERLEITMDDLSEEVKEYIEDGLMSFEQAVAELGGNKFGDRINETRLFKPNVKDFLNGAEETDLTIEDFVITREETHEDIKNETDENNIEEDVDIDDLI